MPTNLTLVQACQIAQKAIDYSLSQDENIVVNVLNANRKLIVFMRMDGCSEINEEKMAFAKAYTAIVPKITGVPGEIDIRDEDGQVLGAIGVSGSTDENTDEEIAKAAVSWWNY